jgi:hypothetical protein
LQYLTNSGDEMTKRNFREHVGVTYYQKCQFFYDDLLAGKVDVNTTVNALAKNLLKLKA